MTTNLQQADGSLRTIDGRDVLRYERRLAHSVKRVWRAITRPEEIVQWLAEAELEPATGGKVVLRWLNTPEQTVARGTVTGWHIHLDHLAEALDGRPQDWSRWMEDQLPQWQIYHDRYLARHSG